MPFQAILREVDQLHSVSARLETLAEQYPPLSEPLIAIAGTIRNAATLLEVLVATKGPEADLSTTGNSCRARPLEIPRGSHKSQVSALKSHRMTPRLALAFAKRLDPFR